jgi:dTMP kinase
MDFNWCKSSDVGLPAPDLVIYLDMEISQTMERGGYGEERYEKKEMQLKVKENFKKLMDSKWQTINGVGSIESIHSQISKITESTIDSAANSDVDNLWTV